MFFHTLDLDKDGFLSRSDLNTSAKRLGWSWNEAPLLAVFDLLSIPKPIPKRKFIAHIQQILNDPLGPYGNILLKSQHFLKPALLRGDPRPNEETDEEDQRNDIQKKEHLGQPDFDRLAGLLENAAGTEAARQYQSLLETLETARIPVEKAALIIIDPQRSFTQGVWMQSIGRGGNKDVVPIGSAFDNCSVFLSRYYGKMEIMFTRCPFPADSYGWASRISDILDRDQIYFIKPGNSVLFPRTNGFRQWVNRCMDQGINTLIMGGCTLNSCVRVSSIQASRKFRGRNLKVVVDLSLCGARAKNYMPSPVFNGLSAVESAVVQMLDEGIQVVRQINAY